MQQADTDVYLVLCGGLCSVQMLERIAKAEAKQYEEGLKRDELFGQKKATGSYAQAEMVVLIDTRAEATELGACTVEGLLQCPAGAMSYALRDLPLGSARAAGGAYAFAFARRKLTSDDAKRKARGVGGTSPCESMEHCACLWHACHVGAARNQLDKQMRPVDAFCHEPTCLLCCCCLCLPRLPVGACRSTRRTAGCHTCSLCLTMLRSLSSVC